MKRETLNLAILAPHCDGTAVGEAFYVHEWVKRLAQVAKVTLLTQTKEQSIPASAQLPNIEVVEWPEILLPTELEEAEATMKPSYTRYSANVRGWLKEEMRKGRKIDLIHQLTPFDLRYASPARGFGIPYILGPHGGSLPTPSSFRNECQSAQLFTHLRVVDQYRLKADPWLRRSFAESDCVLGVAPYVRDILRPIGLRRFEVISELGIEDVVFHEPKNREPGHLHLLHVGRAVRTKGLRDCVRALSLLREKPNITLTQVGCGEELEACKQEAKELRVEDRVRFLGQVSRPHVERLYAEADVFLFPSFRDPSGGVIYEAMRHGLPIIAADRGGPAHVVDENSGILVPARRPWEFAELLADSISRLASNPDLRHRFSEGARARIMAIGYWPNKIERMMDIYYSVLEQRKRTRKGVR